MLRLSVDAGGCAKLRGLDALAEALSGLRPQPPERERERERERKRE